MEAADAASRRRHTTVRYRKVFLTALLCAASLWGGANLRLRRIPGCQRAPMGQPRGGRQLGTEAVWQRRRSRHACSSSARAARWYATGRDRPVVPPPPHLRPHPHPPSLSVLCSRTTSAASTQTDRLCVCLPSCLSVCLSACLSVCLSICLCVYLSAHRTFCSRTTSPCARQTCAQQGRAR